MPGIGLPYLIDLSAIIASIFAAQPIFAGLSDFTFEPKLLAEHRMSLDGFIKQNNYDKDLTGEYLEGIFNRFKKE